NIYTVVNSKYLPKIDNTVVCRIKGKVLSDIEDSYNPLAVGDWVKYSDELLIYQRLERKNSFERYNLKSKSNQTLVANMDLVLIVGSKDKPPFRPRFIDRAIVCSHDNEIMILLNKGDLELDDMMRERFDLYKELGYNTKIVSAFNEHEIQELKEELKGLKVALIGQSGVGKSTIINALLGSQEVQKIGNISHKYQRGRHTTRFSVMLDAKEFLLVDTPGMRELHIPTTEIINIASSFPEFRKVADECTFSGCLHIHEPGCAVKRDLEMNLINEDRYFSYLRMVEALEERPTRY
ncbi:MAG: ribosome small subunit-dependent GTPase A, partial [Sphaerochaetaceae bacterium]